MKTVPPVAQTNCQVLFYVRKPLEKHIKAGERLMIIEQLTGHTLWVSPVVCVSKKTGNLCVHVDMTCLNKAIKQKCHSKSTINVVINNLNVPTIIIIAVRS